MRVAIVGGTGFVGGYLIDALVASGHDVVALVRPGSEDKLRGGERVKAVPGELGKAAVLRDLVDGCDAVIYNVGLLREFPRQGITFEQAQFQGVVDTVNAMRQAGVRRLLLMSAIGVKHPGTKYQSTKRRAEQHALDSKLDVTVLRPSVIFGNPRGTMEFATQLYRDMVRPPFPAVSFPGVKMSPVFIEDVADAFVAALEDNSTIGKTIELAGPEILSWDEIVARIADAVGRKKTVLPMPIWFMRAGATLFDWLPFYPVTRDQLTMLEEGNTAPSSSLQDLIGRAPQPMSAEALSYLGK
jgi:NADH dehydrogenase